MVVDGLLGLALTGIEKSRDFVAMPQRSVFSRRIIPKVRVNESLAVEPLRIWNSCIVGGTTGTGCYRLQSIGFQDLVFRSRTNIGLQGRNILRMQPVHIVIAIIVHS